MPILIFAYINQMLSLCVEFLHGNKSASDFSNKLIAFQAKRAGGRTGEIEIEKWQNDEVNAVCCITKRNSISEIMSKTFTSPYRSLSLSLSVATFLYTTHLNLTFTCTSMYRIYVSFADVCLHTLFFALLNCAKTKSGFDQAFRHRPNTLTHNFECILRVNTIECTHRFFDITKYAIYLLHKFPFQCSNSYKLRILFDVFELSNVTQKKSHNNPVKPTSYIKYVKLMQGREREQGF